MNCPNIRKDLVAYLDNELDQSRQGEIARHLATCPDCHDEAAKLDQTWKILDNYPGGIVPANFTQQVMARTKEEPVASGFNLKRFIPYFAAAAVILLALTATFLLTHQSPPPDNGLTMDELALMEESEVSGILNDSDTYNNGNMDLVNVELGEADDDWEETLLFLE